MKSFISISQCFFFCLLLVSCNREEVTGENLVPTDFNNNLQTIDIYFIVDNTLFGVRDNNFNPGGDVGTMEAFLEVPIPATSTITSTPFAFYTNGVPDKQFDDRNRYEDTRLAITTGDGELHLYDIPSGELLWSTYLNGTLQTSPVLSLRTDNLIVGNGSGVLFALNQNSGTIVWSFSNPAGVPFEQVEMLQSFGNSEKVIATTTTGQVYALDPEDGNELWNYDTGGISVAKPLHIFNAVDGIESVIVIQQGGTMFRIATDTGTVLWSRQLPQPTAVFGSPSNLDDDTTNQTQFFVPSANRRVYYVNIATGDVDWFIDTQGSMRSSISSRILDTDVAIAMDDEGNVYQMDMVSFGAIAWTYAVEQGAGFLNSPVLAGNRNFEVDGTPRDLRRVYVKSATTLYGIDMDGGLGSQFLFNTNNSGEDGGFIAPVMGSPMVLDVDTSDGTIKELHFPAHIDNLF